ncbi:hypothetical protein P6144_13870 [Sphingomonas sp. HITSZ_GF]|uniref:hypothetical protein n=1 Tax=Sphingomonas sp. HITSZ_GF TaxID=3037247 RepID=UPI00240D5AF1|nr:hypothetical protein [Sphingomonas sp. HITSZ_GF]MDG2534745.1 hypothetical protein [Sphingomonas sp. HITSZ_GF]
MSWFERIVVVFALLTAVGVMISAGMGLFQSAAITSFFVGVAAATLTFHFLGGVGDAGWNTPGVKLGGAAAVLVAVGGISFTQLKPELERRDVLLAKVQSLKGVVTERDKRIAALETLASNNVPKDNAAHWLEIVRIATPGSDLGKSLIEIQESRQGPWREVVAPAQTVQISFHRKTEKDGKRWFTACSGLGLDNVDSRRIRFAVKDSETSGETEPVEAISAGTLPATNCEGEDSNRVQLSCEAALVMVPEFAQGCTPTGEVKWAAGKDKRRFVGSAEILRQ